MAKLVQSPAQISSGSPKKIIEEFFGKINTEQKDVSIAVMTAKEGWEEPGQIAKFTEYVYIISGKLFVKTKKHDYIIHEKHAIEIEKGEWVQFSAPFNGGAHYIAICIPAFQEKLVKRDKK